MTAQEDAVLLNLQTFLVLVTVFLVSSSFIQWLRAPTDLPPGPAGWPLLGVLPRLGKKPHRTFQRWWAHYGDVYSLHMGTRLCVVINGVNAMKETFVKQGDVFVTRPWFYLRKIARNRGLVLSDGAAWKEHRRFTLSSLRDFGMGRISLQLKIHEELSAFMEELSKTQGQPVDISIMLPKAITNVICSILYGTRFEYEDPILERNLKALVTSVENQSLISLVNFIPSLEVLLKIKPLFRKLMANAKLREVYAQQQIDAHKESYDSENPRDFIDVYFKEMNRRKNQGLRTTFEETQLNRTIQDLFITGTGTINNSLKWAFLFMLHNEDVQTKVQEEIDDILGTGRLPSVKDEEKMPYTMATIYECQRMGSIALFSVPRRASEDTTLCGYHIPKGAWIFFNRWGIHNNSRYWKHSEKFDPTRFLDKDGQAFKPAAFVPFGVGPRMCMGESLARMELFLFFTTILQNFNLRLPQGRPLPSLDPIVGINMCPQPYEMCITPR